MRANLPPLPDSFSSQQGPGSLTAAVGPILASSVYIKHILPPGLRPGNALNKDACAQSQFCQSYSGSTWCFLKRILSGSAFLSLPPHLPSPITSSYCSSSQSISSVSSPSSGHVMEWKEYRMHAPRVSVPGSAFSTCWPCEIQSFLPHPHPPLRASCSPPP